MKRLKKVYVEITNVCNLSCDFCPKTDRPAEFMSKKSFEEILQKIKGETEHLYFHVMGEPLLHPEIGFFLELCQRYGYRANITTNGTLIDEAADSILSKPALRQVNFSLHSFEGNAYEYHIDSYLDKIFRFINKARNDKGFSICLRLWNLSEGKHNYNWHILRRIEREFSLNFKIEDKLTPCNGVKLADRIFLNQAAKFDWPGMEDDNIPGKAFCHGLRDQAAILVDGTVVPCCLDGQGIIKLGNIKEQDFSSIINGHRANAIYNGFSRREAVEDLCRKCSYRLRFNI